MYPLHTNANLTYWWHFVRIQLCLQQHGSLWLQL